MAFSGVFQSAGIFPIFNDTLRLQSDYSLGFKRSTPLEGFKIYNGKADYFNDIHLSHAGLKGIGTLEYLNSSSISCEVAYDVIKQRAMDTIKASCKFFDAKMCPPRFELKIIEFGVMFGMLRQNCSKIT